MELLKQDEIEHIVKQYGFDKVSNWSIENYSDKLIGYLGDHLRLTVELESENKIILIFFAKCMPRFDEWKANYLKELSFFKKEYVMLSRLFKDFDNYGGSKWRPKLLFVKENIFVFEDVAKEGYVMPFHRNTMSYDEIIATVEAVAKYHAQSYIFEEKKSKELHRPYRIWEDYNKYLQEPKQGQNWRNAGRNAVIDFLKVYSVHKTKPNFIESLETVVPKLFDDVMALMEPSSVYRNVVIHRDLWSNNIFLKKQDNGKLHALLVDFQTVLYCPPMLDLSSIIYFNTTREFRSNHVGEILDFYYETLSKELKTEGVDINTVFDKPTLITSYEESVLFGITQAAIIVPIIAMNGEKREQLFSNPATAIKINVVSRSEEFIQIAKEDDVYRCRVTELFDDIVERYIYPKANNNAMENGTTTITT